MTSTLAVARASPSRLERGRAPGARRRARSRLMSRVFGTDLAQATSTGANDTEVTHRHRTGGLSIPAALGGVVTAVLGLDDRPQARAHSGSRPQRGQHQLHPARARARSTSSRRTPTAAGQTIAIIELGGGFAQSDLDTYFCGLGITGPDGDARSAWTARSNVPGGDPNGADGEVMLDIEVAGALAPGADILVYFAPNTDAGFLDAVTTAAHADPDPRGRSASAGARARTSGPRRHARRSTRRSSTPPHSGVTTTVAAGRRRQHRPGRRRQGRTSTSRPRRPHALACGGTRLAADASTGDGADRRRSGTTAPATARPAAA